MKVTAAEQARYDKRRHTTTRQRLLTNMAPLLMLLVIAAVIGMWLGCWYGLFISAKHGDVAWCIFWATVLIVGTDLNSKGES